MSRHRIPAADEPSLEIWVGWDPPLASFFAQVIDPARSEENNPVLWVGADPKRQLLFTDDLQAALKPYAVLSQDMIRTLFDDKMKNRA